jgi:hypothetical protein
METAPTNLIGTNEQKTVTYCMIDGRLLDEWQDQMRRLDVIDGSMNDVTNKN